MTIEELYKKGKIPQKYYNQLNGKTAQDNYKDIIDKRNAKREQEEQLKEQIKEQIDIVLSELLDNLNK